MRLSSFPSSLFSFSIRGWVPGLSSHFHEMPFPMLIISCTGTPHSLSHSHSLHSPEKRLPLLFLIGAQVPLRHRRVESTGYDLSKSTHLSRESVISVILIRHFLFPPFVLGLFFSRRRGLLATPFTVLFCAFLNRRLTPNSFFLFLGCIFFFPLFNAGSNGWRFRITPSRSAIRISLRPWLQTHLFEARWATHSVVILLFLLSPMGIFPFSVFPFASRQTKSSCPSLISPFGFASTVLSIRVLDRQRAYLFGLLSGLCAPLPGE